LDFSIAELLFRISAPAGVSDLIAPDEYEKFLVVSGNARPDASYEAVIADTVIPCGAPVTPSFWDNGLWRTCVTGDQYLDIDIFDIGIKGWRRAARMSPDFSNGKLWVSASASAPNRIRPLYHPQDRAIIIGRLCHLGGVMMHASSVAHDGKVMLFSGMSGAGKTTIARLWRQYGGTILNDERNMIHLRPEGARAGASPWHGEENKIDPTTGPLSAIFFLKQASVNHLRLMPLTESLGRMMTTAFIPVFIPEGPALTLDTCAAILQVVPAYELSFTPDTRALDLCLSV